jgi:hypothetical protein
LHAGAAVICDHPPCGTPESFGLLRDVADALLYFGP